MTPEQIEEFISDAYDAPVATVSMLCERINEAESDLAALRAAVEALAGRLRSFPEPKPGTYLRGRYDASLALADDLAALLPGGDASNPNSKETT